MDDVLPWPEHPSCVPEIAADFRASDRRAREARRRGELGRARAAANHPEAKERGLQIIRAAAETHEYVSANTVRDDMEAADVPLTKLSGALWTIAARRGWIEHASDETGGRTANGKPVHVYRSKLYRGAVAS